MFTTPANQHGKFGAVLAMFILAKNLQHFFQSNPLINNSLYSENTFTYRHPKILSIHEKFETSTEQKRNAPLGNNKSNVC